MQQLSKTNETEMESFHNLYVNFECDIDTRNKIGDVAFLIFFLLSHSIQSICILERNPLQSNEWGINCIVVHSSFTYILFLYFFLFHLKWLKTNELLREFVRFFSPYWSWPSSSLPSLSVHIESTQPKRMKYSFFYCYTLNKSKKS